MRRAFTLLELIAVLIIVGVLASLVLLSLRTHFDRVALVTAADRLAEADRQARQLARRLPADSVQLRIDTQRNEIAVGEKLRTYHLPMRISCDAPVQLTDGGWRATNGDVQYGGNGSSATYYIRLSAGELRRWLVVFGLSGQCTHCDSEAQLQELVQ